MIIEGAKTKFYIQKSPSLNLTDELQNRIQVFMKKKSIRYKGKVVFDKVHMEGSFQRLPKLFQEDEACFLYMSEGSFTFRTPTNLIEIKAGEAIVAKCGNYFIEQSSHHNQEKEIIAFGAYFYPEMVKEFFQTDLKLVDFKRNYDVSISKVETVMIFIFIA